MLLVQFLHADLAYGCLQMPKLHIWFWWWCWRVETEVDPFVDHQGSRCLTISGVHYRNLVMKPPIYLHFSSFVAVSCNLATCRKIINLCTPYAFYTPYYLYYTIITFSPGKGSGHLLQPTTYTEGRISLDPFIFKLL